MSKLNFNYDKKVRKTNRMIRNAFGADCNCYCCYDTSQNIYRLAFFNTYKLNRKTIQSQISNTELNHIFLNNPNGIILRDDATFEQIQTYCIQHLNEFDCRKFFLLFLCDMFINEFNMPYGGAVSEVTKWQECILTIYYHWKTKKQVVLLLDYKTLAEDINMKNNPLTAMTSGLEVKISAGGFKYVELELDLEILPNTIRLYSNW